MNLNKQKDIVLPNYDHCILGTITSILKYYNVETKHESLKVIDEKLESKKYRNILFLVLDGLGNELLKEISKDGILSKNKVDVVTSVYPSTTTAALTTYYSGMPPYETGWIAWSQYFKEYGRALDMFSHKESYLQEQLHNPMIDVFKGIMKYETVYEKIEKASPSVKTHEIGPEYADRRGNRSYIADTYDELEMYIRDIVKQKGENFILAYSDKPDGLLHKFGTDSDEVKEFILYVEKKLEKLVEDIKDETLIIISADHGHKNIEKAYTLLDYPEIQECLIMPAYLESRVLTFWVKDTMRKEFVERFNKQFEEEFILVDKDTFLNKNEMLGKGNKHPKIDDFIGDYVAMSKSGSMIRIETFLHEGKEVKKSTHCGLTKEEMLVPVILI